MHSGEHCFASHIGLWAIDGTWAQQALAQFSRGLWKARQLESTLQAYSERVADESYWHFLALSSEVQRKESKLYSQIEDVALIRVVDQMTKAPSSMGGTSTILTRRALRQALADDEVTSVLFAVDSPGGMVAGTYELAEDIRLASERKPVAAFYEDLAASAAIWATTFAQRITANVNAQIGSIGVVAELIDSSGMAEREGLKVHVVSTGSYKGLGAPGTPITTELLEEVDGIVRGIGQQFFRAVQQGRRLSNQRLTQVTTGQLWLASQAQDLGLVDGVETFEQAFEAAKKMRPRRKGMMQYAEQQQRVAALRAGLGITADSEEGH